MNHDICLYVYHRAAMGRCQEGSGFPEITAPGLVVAIRIEGLRRRAR